MSIKNKFGQLGDTITWVIATIVIVAILLFFIFGASLLAHTKKISSFKSSLTSKAIHNGDDFFLRKSIYAYYSINSIRVKKLIEENLQKMEKEGDFKISLNETQKQVLKNMNRK